MKNYEEDNWPDHHFADLGHISLWIVKVQNSIISWSTVLAPQHEHPYKMRCRGARNDSTNYTEAQPPSKCPSKCPSGRRSSKRGPSRCLHPFFQLTAKERLHRHRLFSFFPSTSTRPRCSVCILFARLRPLLTYTGLSIAMEAEGATTTKKAKSKRRKKAKKNMQNQQESAENQQTPTINQQRSTEKQQDPAKQVTMSITL